MEIKVGAKKRLYGMVFDDTIQLANFLYDRKINKKDVEILIVDGKINILFDDVVETTDSAFKEVGWIGWVGRNGSKYMVEVVKYVRGESQCSDCLANTKLNMHTKHCDVARDYMNCGCEISKREDGESVIFKVLETKEAY